MTDLSTKMTLLRDAGLLCATVGRANTQKARRAVMAELVALQDRIREARLPEFENPILMRAEAVTGALICTLGFMGNR